MRDGDADIEIIGPASSHYVSQGLRLHYVDWGNPHAAPLVLIHGGRDHARSWDQVARDLRRDHHVVAPDLRGHGDSEWARGGSYAIQEFVLDVARLIEALGERRVTLVAHSLGGNVALQYASIFPGRVERLVSIEGLGPSPRMWEERTAVSHAERLAEWIDRTRELSGKRPRAYPSIEAAAERMLEANSFLSREQALHLTVHGVARNEDGSFRWKFDNAVRSHMPQRGTLEDQREVWSRITCPTLLVRGARSWASDPEEDGRITAFPRARRVNIEGAGHWVHHDQLDRFLAEVRRFLAEDPGGGAQGK
ncbi:MAG: alpha/beta fold hydrolase [Myxococcota bacterium]